MTALVTALIAAFGAAFFMPGGQVQAGWNVEVLARKGDTTALFRSGPYGTGPQCNAYVDDAMERVQRDGWIVTSARCVKPAELA